MEDKKREENVGEGKRKERKQKRRKRRKWKRRKVVVKGGERKENKGKYKK